MSEDERSRAVSAGLFGFGPLAHLASVEAGGKGDPVHSAFGGEMQPGLFRGVEKRRIANPAPLGLAAFALTTFMLSLINLGTLGLTDPSIIIALGFGYGGLVQLLAGMWEMAIGNTFGATALSSYGGFWLSFAILLTPGGFQIEDTTKTASGPAGLLKTIGLFLMGWFIFTFILVLCTLKSTVAFCMLFVTLDLAFLLLGVAYLRNDGAVPHQILLKAGGGFGIISAFLAWYNAFAGLADTSNSFFIIPAIYFPWTARKKE
ncbi:Meiotically up-regulated protein 86 protein [Malassezia sp. CBS 17886]|nr:Meiotically up-regulated protein 86 protein [Malassezia sp. CBS 17886]